MKKNIIWGVMLACSTLALFWQIYRNNDHIQEQELNAAISEHDSKQKELELLKKTNAGIKKQIDDLSAETAQGDTTVKELEDKINKLKSRIKDIEEKIKIRETKNP